MIVIRITMIINTLVNKVKSKDSDKGEGDPDDDGEGDPDDEGDDPDDDDEVSLL